ncbi:hypothetical protein J6590_046568 [Homalodisca vitripennis]|nr:hypothetical protein J6590_046568 [Homalodisca vitripennis]
MFPGLESILFVKNRHETRVPMTSVKRTLSHCDVNGRGVRRGSGTWRQRLRSKERRGGAFSDGRIENTLYWNM